MNPTRKINRNRLQIYTNWGSVLKFVERMYSVWRGKKIMTIEERERIIRFINSEEAHIIKPRLDPSESGSRADVLVAVTLMFYIVWLTLSFIVPQTHDQNLIEFDSENEIISLSLNHPKFVAVGDERYMDITVINQTSERVTGAIIIDFDGNHNIAMSNPSTNKLVIQKLAPQMRQTLRMGFVLNEKWQDDYGQQQEPIKFDVKMMLDNNDIQNTYTYEMSVAPLPYLYSTIVSGGALNIVGLVLLVVFILPDEWLKYLKEMLV